MQKNCICPKPYRSSEKRESGLAPSLYICKLLETVTATFVLNIKPRGGRNTKLGGVGRTQKILDAGEPKHWFCLPNVHSDSDAARCVHMEIVSEIPPWMRDVSETHKCGFKREKIKVRNWIRRVSSYRCEYWKIVSKKKDRLLRFAPCRIDEGIKERVSLVVPIIMNKCAIAINDRVNRLRY